VTKRIKLYVSLMTSLTLLKGIRYKNAQQKQSLDNTSSGNKQLNNHSCNLKNSSSYTVKKLMHWTCRRCSTTVKFGRNK